MHDITTLYGCSAIMQAFEDEAAANDGVLTEEGIQRITEAHTTSLAKLESIGSLIQYLDRYINMAQGEIDRINELKRVAKNRLESVKKFVLPFVIDQREKLGRPIEAGAHKFSTRKSTAVVITDPDSFAAGCYPTLSTKKTTYTPDKTKIKELLQKGKTHPGAELEDRTTLVVK